MLRDLIARSPARTPLAGALLVTALAPLSAACAASLARVDVYDRTAQSSLETHHYRGRQYIVGRPGNEYAIRIRNTTDRRVLAVVSVDGVNVVTGETASPDQSGYVIEPGDYVNIEGWRKGLDRTAAFYFTDPADSYASRTGRPDDLGVIGVALFREREYRPDRAAGRIAAPGASARAEPAAKAADASRESTAAAAAPAMEPELGTGHGRSEYSPVERVQFERASRRPDQRVAIRYDRRENLIAMGVLSRRDHGWHEPDPFPASLGFVPDP